MPLCTMYSSHLVQRPEMLTNLNTKLTSPHLREMVSRNCTLDCVCPSINDLIKPSILFEPDKYTRMVMIEVSFPLFGNVLYWSISANTLEVQVTQCKTMHHMTKSGPLLSYWSISHAKSIFIVPTRSWN